MNAPGRPTITTFLLARYGPSAIFSGGKFSVCSNNRGIVSKAMLMMMCLKEQKGDEKSRHSNLLCNSTLGI